MKENNFEKREEVKTETLTAEELVDLIYKGESLPQDFRFLSEEDGGVFHYFDPRDLQENKENKFYSVVKADEEITGLGELEKNPFEKDERFWVKFISVDPKYRGKGYASLLAREMFEFAKAHGFSLEGSAYSDSGYEKLKGVFNKLAGETGVRFIDTERRI
jgi:GNAT superfamily N-acetyltransferase